MANISVGSVSVRVVPDAGDFAKDLRAKLVPVAAQIGAQVGKAISEGITKGFGDPLSGPLRDLPAKQKPKSQKDGEEIGGAFASGFERRLRAALAALPKAKIDAESSEADRKVAELRARMEELSRKTIGIDIDAAKALAEINAIKVELDKVGRNAPIHVQADTAAAIAQLDAVQAMAAKVAAEHATVDVNADTATADAELAATDAEVKSLDGKTARINVDVSGALSSLGTLASQIGIIGPALASLGVGAGAGLASLAAPLAAAGTGLVGFGAVAAPAVSRIKDALQAQTQAAQQSAATSVQVQQRALAEAAAQQQLASAVRNQAYAHQQALQQVGAAEQQLAQAQVSAREAQISLTEARQAERQRLQDLKNSLTDANLSIQQDQINVDKARLAMQQLNTAQADAVRIQQAQQALAQAQAAQQTVGADPGATAAQKTQAQISVQAAQAALKSAQNQQQANEIARRQAQLAYQQAVQQLKEEQLAYQRLQQEQAKANKQGVEGSDQVRRAREALAQANQRVQNSEQALGQARQNVYRSDQQAAQQVTAAQRALQQAQLQSASSNTALAAAMGKLSPAARQLMVAWQGFSQVYRSWQASLEPTVLPVLANGLNLLKGIFPLLTPAVRGTASALNQLLNSARQALGGPFWQTFATTIGGLAHGSVLAFGKSLGNIATGVAGIVQAFAPFAPIVLGAITRATGAFSVFGKNLSAFQPIIGQILGSFGRILTGLAPAIRALLGAVGQIAAPLLGALSKVAGALGAALVPVIRALVPVVQQLFAALAPLLVQLINGLRPILVALVPIIGQVIRALQPVIAALLSGLQPVIASLVPVVGLLVGALGRILGALAPVLPVLGNLIAALVSGLMPVITPIITLISRMAAQLAGALISALRATLPSVQQIVLAIASLLPALMPLIPLWVQWETALLPLLPSLARLVATVVTLLVPILRVLITVIVAIATRVVGLLIPVLRFLVSIVTFVFNAVRVVLNAVMVVLRALGTAALWLWHNAIAPAFNAIMTVGKVFAAILLFVVIAPLVLAFKVLQAIVLFLWRNVFVPAWNGIWAVMKWVWENGIRPVLQALYKFINATLVPLFRWFWNSVIKPVWNGIWSTIKWVWENGIKPVFDGLKSAIGLVGKAFDAGASAIKYAWDKIKDYTKAPVNFVIGTVYDKGIVGLWNKVMGWLHLPGSLKLGTIPLLESGGTLDNPAPAVPMKTNKPMAIVGEGGPHPEYVIPTDPKYRGRAQALWAAAGGDLQMLASGGILGGVLGTVKKIAGSVVNLGKDALDLITNPKAVWDKLAAPILGEAKGLATGPWGDAVAAVPPKLMGEVWTAAKSIIDAFSSAFGGAGGQAMASLALTQVGTRENPPGSNMQPYGAAIGENGVAWCAIFLEWLSRQTGQRSAIPQTASAPGMASAFGSRFQSGSSGIQTGDIVFFDEGQGSIVHTGIAVTPKVGGSWTSVEGNYGDRVAKNTRTSAAGFAHPAYTGGAVGSFPGGSLVHASPAAAQAWARQALVGFGWSGQAGDLINLWNRESGWRWNAQNPSSGAYGIPQSLPASKMASAGSDWRDNAATQIKWGLNYIKGRYHSPAAAWSHELSAGWYDNGGILPTGPSLVYNGTGEDEYVFRRDQIEALISGASGGGTHYHAHMDGWTRASVQSELRTTFHAMEVSNANRERIGRRR